MEKENMFLKCAICKRANKIRLLATILNAVEQRGINFANVQKWVNKPFKIEMQPLIEPFTEPHSMAFLIYPI